MDEQHLVLIWLIGKKSLSVADSPLVRRELLRLLPYPVTVYIRFEGLAHFDSQFIAHSIGALYWYRDADQLKQQFKALGIRENYRGIFAHGLEIAKLGIAHLRDELKADEFN